ncbi:MAG TPA: apolipoprotein N-acyltransferase [Gemmatales bacterium]|nr:apolipoprotein N-acyltransferase [Gemmatales bacterium]
MQRIPALVWCLLSSLLLWLSFFPVNAGWLGWVALVPLVFVLERYVKEERGTRWFERPLLSAWLGGLVFCLAAFRWIALASTPMYAVYFIVALIISLQWFFFFEFSRLLTKTLKLPLMLSAAISWTALEYIRAEIWIGYAWYYLGHTQHEEVYFTQAADLAGVYGLSFIMVMVNVALARLIKERSLKVVSFELVPAVILVGLACWYGSMVINADAQELARPQSPRLAILQGSQPQDLRNDRDTWQKIDKTYAILGDDAARFNPELIIAPETCISVTWFRLPNGQVPPWAAAKFPELNLAGMANYHRSWAEFVPPRWKTYLLFGFNTFDFRGEEMRHTNSALLINPAGDLVDVYDKIICLPFGEYIPWAETLPFMKLLSPYPCEYTVQPGTDIHALRWKNHRLAALVCYEDTVPGLARSFTLQENPSFFVNISNDGWFKGSEEHEQHLVCARFRCIENRRAMVRSVNMGISCIIDGLGRVIALPSPVGGKGVPGVFTGNAPGSTWHEVKGKEGLLVGTVPLYTQISLYTRLGDVLPWICWGMMTLAWIVSVVRARKKSTTS